ncbi:F0F1 ATP synthase subunit B [Allocoprobacillus halotolerans]|uniref:ATP synthase subunit b n=1 Tax=Allocoprobacillus halotolerans TaxID=2944914 RepID=A0ABY5I4T6_9FIRM|nr:F0F1 ATP synthase subunit B [Allocoprobacillus halotolerans]UTY40369.1 F0F1 ATP synthase subunit B [Allocoprobacillus halotolerans]
MSIDVAGKLFPNLATIVIQLLSTGVLLIIFRKFFWGPVQAYFKKRADFIESQIQDAKTSQEKAKQLMLESEEQARQSAKEYHDIIERAKDDALKVRDEMVTKAKEEAARKLEQAERQIEVEKQQAREEMKKEMVDIAIEAATKVMSKEMNTKENQQMVEDFVDQVVH